jgi:hypothetical protein
MSGLVSRSEKAAATDDIALRTLIIAKIHDGRLPRTALPHVWGGPGHGATCSACEDTISKRELEIEADLMDGNTFMFHVRCFQLWDEERKAVQGRAAHGGRRAGARGVDS